MKMLNTRIVIFGAVLFLSLMLAVPTIALAGHHEAGQRMSGHRGHGHHGAAHHGVGDHELRIMRTPPAEPMEPHGPMPVAALGSVFGGAMWLVSVPFTALLAPDHVMDSFDTMVMLPWRTATGE